MFFLNAILKLHVGINLPCLIFLGNFCILEFILHTNEYILFKLDMFFFKFLFLCFNFLNRNLLILKCLIFIRIVTVYTLTEQLQLICFCTFSFELYLKLCKFLACLCKTKQNPASCLAKIRLRRAPGKKV